MGNKGMSPDDSMQHNPTTLDQETEGSRKEKAPDVCECEGELNFFWEIWSELVTYQVIQHLRHGLEN